MKIPLIPDALSVKVYFIFSEGKEALSFYSSFEKTRLNDLRSVLPERESELDDVISRLFDLLIVIRNHCYHPEFQGSFSIKKVLPALVPHLGYSDLTIGDGGSASQAYAEMFDNCPAERLQELMQALLEYCKRDTIAMVELFKYLKGVLLDTQ